MILGFALSILAFFLVLITAFILLDKFGYITGGNFAIMIISIFMIMFAIYVDTEGIEYKTGYNETVTGNLTVVKYTYTKDNSDFNQAVSYSTFILAIFLMVASIFWSFEKKKKKDREEISY